MECFSFLQKNSLDFAQRIERMLRLSVGVAADAPVEVDEETAEEEKTEEEVSADEEEEESKDAGAEKDEKEAAGEEKSEEKKDEAVKPEDSTEDVVEGETKETPAEAKDEL